jgi:hypothetical protein
MVLSFDQLEQSRLQALRIWQRNIAISMVSITVVAPTLIFFGPNILGLSENLV